MNVLSVKWRETHLKAHPVIVVLQEICTHNLVSCEEILTGNRREQDVRWELQYRDAGNTKKIERVYLEWGKSVWSYVKGWELHVTEKAVQLFREEHRPRQRLVTQALSQHHSTVQSHLCAFISVQVNTCQVWVNWFTLSGVKICQLKNNNHTQHKWNWQIISIKLRKIHLENTLNAIKQDVFNQTNRPLLKLWHFATTLKCHKRRNRWDRWKR